MTAGETENLGPSQNAEAAFRDREQHRRRRTDARCLSACSVVLVLAAGSVAAPPIDPIAAIRQAGNTEDEAERLRILRSLRTAPALDSQLAADLDRMITFLERWNGDPSLYRWFDQEVRRTADYDFSIAAGSPLAPLACFYRRRMLTWITNEYGNIIGYHKERRRFLDRAARDFRIAAAAFPENRVIRMYLGSRSRPTSSTLLPSARPREQRSSGRASSGWRT